MRMTALVSLFALACSALPAVAQTPRAESLRQKIASLQQELDETEETPKRYSHVTQIGGSRGPERREDLVVKLYDLSDLFAVAPPYTAERFEGLAKTRGVLFPQPVVEGTRGGTGGMGMGGGMGGMGGGFFNLADKSPKLPDAEQNTPLQQQRQQDAAAANRNVSQWASMDDLIQAITSTISPTSWDEVGGPGTISRLGNALLISSTRQNHDQIDALLQLFRQRWGTLRTISVRAWWLWIDEARVAKLLSGGEPAAKGEAAPAFGLVDPQLWEKLLAELSGPDRPEQLGYRASLTCYNGQTVSTQTARQSLLVTDIQPQILGQIPGKDKESSQPIVVYHPTTTIIQEGAALQVTPISNTSGKFIVLDIHSQVTDLLKPAESAPRRAAPRDDGPTLPGPAAVIAAIDRPQLAIQQLGTTLRVPADKVMLIGGMTSDSAPDADRPNLFLFVKVTVQELRDDRESREMPAHAAAEKAGTEKAATEKPAPDKSAPEKAVPAKDGEKGKPDAAKAATKS